MGAENRGSYGSSRGYSGSEGRGAEGRGYGGSRPPLNMRQPIATPRSYGSPYGGRGGYPGYGGRAPSYGGGRAPSYGGGDGSKRRRSFRAEQPRGRGIVTRRWWRVARRRRPRRPSLDEILALRCVTCSANSSAETMSLFQGGTHQFRVPLFFVCRNLPPGVCSKFSRKLSERVERAARKLSWHCLVTKGLCGLDVGMDDAFGVGDIGRVGDFDGEPSAFCSQADSPQLCCFRLGHPEIPSR